MVAMILATAAMPVLAADDDGTASDMASPAKTAPGYLDNARELVVNALAMLGVNYKFGGNSPIAGFDCSGLVSHVFREVSGLILPRRSEAMSKVGEKVDKSVLQPGDLVFFNTHRHPFSHVGIYIGEERFVHAPSRGGQVEISNLDDRYWQKHYSGARRVSATTSP